MQAGSRIKRLHSRLVFSSTSTTITTHYLVEAVDYLLSRRLRILTAVSTSQRISQLHSLMSYGFSYQLPRGHTLLIRIAWASYWSTIARAFHDVA